MKRYIYWPSLNGEGAAVPVVISEVDILESYWEYWSKKKIMSVLSPKECIKEFCERFNAKELID